MWCRFARLSLLVYWSRTYRIGALCVGNVSFQSLICLMGQTPPIVLTPELRHFGHNKNYSVRNLSKLQSLCTNFDKSYYNPKFQKWFSWNSRKMSKLEQYGNKATAYWMVVKFQRNAEHARKVYCSQCSGHRLKGQGHNRSICLSDGPLFFSLRKIKF